MKTSTGNIDSLGRIFLPKKWKKSVRKVRMIEFKDRLTLIPEREIDLTKFFDSLEIEEFEDIEDLKQKALSRMHEEESSP